MKVHVLQNNLLLEREDAIKKRWGKGNKGQNEEQKQKMRRDEMAISRSKQCTAGHKENHDEERNRHDEAGGKGEAERDKQLLGLGLYFCFWPSP